MARVVVRLQGVVCSARPALPSPSGAGRGHSNSGDERVPGAMGGQSVVTAVLRDGNALPQCCSGQDVYRSSRGGSGGAAASHPRLGPEGPDEEGG
eukprot:4962290-Pyramimonas_sp.AAC.1